MFIHSIYLFLHIIFNMFILWILSININRVYGLLKFIIIYFFSGIIVGLLQNMFKIFIIYHYTGIHNLYQISHGFQYNDNIQRINLQYSMYSPIIGSSGAIASIIGSLPTIKVINILRINYILYTILIFLKRFPGITQLLHLSGAIAGYFAGYYISQK